MMLFNQTYTKLNPQQKQAVDTIEGPVMVLAGPGTGKTQVLAARIANILLKTDTNPSSILALTFTESAAKNMRQRLVDMIGKTGYYVQIATFHSFCNEVINTHPEFFPIDRDSEPLTDLERYDIFQSIIADLPFEEIKPINAPLFYVPDLIKTISDLKREGINVDTYLGLVEQEKQSFEMDVNDPEKKISKTERAKKEKKIAKNLEVATVYREYDQRLRANVRFDFDDMIALVVTAFEKHELLLREYQENLHYFLVDEYQDTNSAQNKVVDLLASYWEEVDQQANVFVVGDPNQAIYRFQGASIENALSFTNRYQQAKIINLSIGYRCFQKVHDAAEKVIANNELKIDLLTGAKLESPKGQGNLIKLYSAPSQTLELIYVAEQILQLIKSGVAADEIAVLFRHNRDITELQEVFDKWAIFYQIDGGDNLLENEHIRQVLMLFTVIDQVTHGESDDDLFEVMRYEWLGLDQLSVMKVGRQAGQTKFSVFDLIDQDQDQSYQDLQSFLKLIKNWGQLDAQKVFPEWFENVVTESGYLKWIMEQPNKVDLLNHINSLYREIKALAQSNHSLNLHSFLEAIATMQQHGIRLKTEDLNISKDAVRLSTVHKAKGQEWEYVFIVHCIDGKWGNNRQRELLKLPDGVLKNTDISKKELNEDERRIFYVALTRAKKQVSISYPQTVISGNRTKDVVGSMFIEEVKTADSLVEVVEDQTIVAQADQHLAKLVSPAPEKELRLDSDETAFYQSLVVDFKLSVTALNIYLKDPQEFLVNHLLRVPRAKPEPMAFGTAIHFALEQLFKHIQEHGQKPSLDFVLNHYQTSLKKELLTSNDFERRLAYGIKILTNYFSQLNQQDLHVLYIERYFGGGWSKAYLDDIPLSGRIDRVDWIDPVKKTVRVIDYKTGKPKSVNYIEGRLASMDLSEREQALPKSIRGPYKRQLLFYKLLAELDRSFIPKVTQGIFDFIEPQPSGKLVQRQFDLPDEDVTELKNLIKEVMAEIRALKFISKS